MTDTEMLLDAIKGYQHGRIGMSRDVREAFTALLRRDWSVRVLDAWARERQSRGYEVWDGGDGWEVIGRHMLSEEVEFIGKRGPTPDAARLAAALAVAPTPGCEHCGAGPSDPCDRGVDHSADHQPPEWKENPGAAAWADKLRADARALWSVRVLDEHAAHYNRVTPIAPTRTSRGDYQIWWHTGKQWFGATPDAARLAAALAVFPTLPADVRAELGECP